MKKFEIRYGLGGGFGGCGDWEESNAKNEEDAYAHAHEMAIEEYEMYEGMHGLENTCTIAEENPDWDEDEVWDEYVECRESWLNYEIKEIE